MEKAADSGSYLETEVKGFSEEDKDSLVCLLGFLLPHG